MKQSSPGRWLILLIFVLEFVFPDSTVLAQDPITITGNEVTYSFGSALNISALASAIQVSDVVYIVIKPEGQVSRQIKLIPAGDGQLVLDYDLTRDPLKPFSRVYYWYQFETPDGVIQTSPSFWFDYADNRFEWKSLSSKLFEIHWTDEDASFGQQIMDIAVDGLERSTEILPVAPVLPIQIYVYPNIDALQDALSLSHQPWVAGHASPDLGVALISDGSDQSKLIELERQIPHELMHILQYQITGEAYSRAPAWLLEGLAVLAQAYPNPDDDRLLNSAAQSHSLIPLTDMCQSMPVDANSAALGYAQSKKIVEYLKDQYGSQLFVSMLQSSKSGISCEQNLLNNSELTSEQLLMNWQSAAYPDIAPQARNNSSLLLYLLGGSAVVILGIIAVREIWRKKKTQND